MKVEIFKPSEAMSRAHVLGLAAIMDAQGLTEVRLTPKDLANPTGSILTYYDADTETWVIKRVSATEVKDLDKSLF